MPKPSSPSRRLTAILVTIAGLGLVWGLVWANLPANDQLHASGVSPRSVTSALPPPALDLSIPGVPPPDAPGSHRVVVNGAELPQSEQGGGGLEAASDPRSKQIAEMKCEAELQQACPDSLQGENRRRCMEQRAKHLPPFCQSMVRQQLVRWKEQSGHALACADDVKRFCRAVPSGEGQMLQCLQDHAQDVSDKCYATLPKGALTLRN
ncbi:MAG: cysteine rich repeat-containing protein [Nitrospira sp.]|nr:cysteine rich repeat-containing protein [Nitrospira sp.]